MKNQLPKEKNGLNFIKEVAKYFMDFLETDFHRRRLPRRIVKFRNSDNLLIGINLQKYPTFNNSTLKLISKNFDKNVLNKVSKGTYKTNLPQNLVELIKLQVKKISPTEINSIIEKIADSTEKAGTLYSKEYDKALTSSIEEASKIIKTKLVHPFIENIEQPLQNLNLGDEDNVFLIEEELTSVLLRLVENKISEIINLIIAKGKVNISKELKVLFVPQEIKAELVTFFENLGVADLFLEVFEMDRNKSILDKQEFYLYFGEISFNNNKYPIFYIPIVINRDGDSLNLEFDSQVYINKKAIEFVVQEYNALNGTRGNLDTISERIIYLAQHETDFIELADEILNEISHFFELEGEVSFSKGDISIAKGASIRVTNNCYICLFDKSDEALVNDYEEILQQLSLGGGELAEIFNRLIEDFIEKNPEPYNPEVEDDWDDTEIPDKLVYPSPIPLNSEQRQILSAINKENCNYLVVSGPPGTGKSHTITAIIFEAILKNQSVLVLSDKKEALDVVEDKITETMNKVRLDKNFQNPILRLGKTGNTYNSILSHSAIDGIKTHYRAVKNNYDSLEETIEKSGNTLREDIEAEIVSYQDIDIKEIHEYFDLELYFRDKDLIFDSEELRFEAEAAIQLGELRNSLLQIHEVLESKNAQDIFELYKINLKSFKTINDFKNFLDLLEISLESVKEIKTLYKNGIDSVKNFTKFEEKDLSVLNDFIQKYAKLKFWAVGFLFTQKKAEELDLTFEKSMVNSTISKPHEHLQELNDVYDILSYSQNRGYKISKNDKYIDFVLIFHKLLSSSGFEKSINSLISLRNDIDYISELEEKYPKTHKKINVNPENFSTFSGNLVVDQVENEFDKQIRFLSLMQKVSKDFSNIQDLNYATRMKQIEQLVTTQVTYLLDGRLIKFYEYNKGDAQTLRSIIKSKQRFPKDEFNKLKEAFPCILAGIRDYAEYIPLEPELFDLVIIDEASQVSIAQAFPALIRAKKVLILGDKKQFSNIKAAQARGDTNKEYLNGLQASFKTNISTYGIKLEKLTKFNIKTSILEFLEFISNFNIQLLKHFRGYKEIISFSNKYFYQDSLQVMKIRGKPIDEVIKFSEVEATLEDEVYPNSNQKEVDFIVQELKHLKGEDKAPSVGIITPHTNQQKLLVESFSKLPEWDYFQEKLQLKIMTFDTCQGEERDIIYYSMVASPHSDKLWGVFIKDLNNVDIEEDGIIKTQRLNVGFSRAKESIHFVLSKKVEDFTGSIGEALRHYKYVLEEAKKENGPDSVDKNSKMEPEVLNWFYQTTFWKEHKDNIEFIPGFEIGKYLKQLDRTYTHPAYKVDFLLVYMDERHKENKIILEYDGFKEHFKDIDEINESNYENYYSDADVYRQKVLESYGYKFLRINKFNVGINPIETLDERIGRLLKNPENANSLLTNIHSTIEGLQNGDMRECPKCKEVRSIKDFKDATLITGYGRFCSYCKSNNVSQSSSYSSESEDNSEELECPRCNSRMVLRNGRRGKFYGCSRFPYCKGTRNYL